jgi:hypothetical protein
VDTEFHALIIHSRKRGVTRELYLRIHTLGERLDGIDPHLVDSIRAMAFDATK